MNRSISLVLTVAAFLVCASGSQALPNTTSGVAQADDPAASRVEQAEPDLVVLGKYEDRRFLDMMAAHHEMAIEQARLALERAEHAELRAMARGIVRTQTAEIEEIRSIKQSEYGSTHLPLAMDPHQMDNMGTVTDAKLEAARQFDLAFIDGMVPHHAGAITMASVGILRSNNPRILAMARAIIDAQAAEIGRMIEMRTAWTTTGTVTTPGSPSAATAPAPAATATP
jgi:uncharacterized protein (DUF305 family)